MGFDGVSHFCGIMKMVGLEAEVSWGEIAETFGRFRVNIGGIGFWRCLLRLPLLHGTCHQQLENAWKV